MNRLFAIALGTATFVSVLVAGVWAQSPQPMQPAQMQHGQAQPGQGAFGAMAEVVRTLETDPVTDWSRVDMERLRQHLIDMDEVVLRASVKASQVPGGLSMEITGTGRTSQSIRAMLIPQSAQLDAMSAWSARAEPIRDGVRLIVVARDPADVKTVARIRGLGFAGLLVQGGHHGPHHLAMAKGELPTSHKH
jgi:hypothetical protein